MTTIPLPQWDGYVVIVSDNIPHSMMENSVGLQQFRDIRIVYKAALLSNLSKQRKYGRVDNDMTSYIVIYSC